MAQQNLDFRFKGEVPMSTIIDAAAQKPMRESQLHNDALQSGQNIVSNLQQTAQTVSGMVANSVQMAKDRQIRDARNSLAQLLSQSSAKVAAPGATMIPPSSLATGEQGPQQTVQGPSYPSQTVPYGETPEFKSQFMSSLSKVNPQGFTKAMSEQAAKSMFQKPDPGTLSHVPVMRNNAPDMVLSDTHGNYFDRDTKKNLTGEDIKPYAPTAQSEITDADRARLTKLAPSVIEGRASINSLVNARGGDKEKLAIIISEMDPNFDLSLAPQRVTIRKEYSPAGTQGKNLMSASTVIGHMDSLYDKINALDNTQIPKFNSIANYVKNNTGQPEVRAFIANKNFVISELGKIAQGSGVVTAQDKEDIAKAIDNASSKEQAKAVIDTWIDIMKSRTDTIKSAWDQTMPGVSPPTPFLTEKAKQKLEKHGYNPDTMEKVSNDSSTGNSNPLDSIDIHSLGKALGLKRK